MPRAATGWTLALTAVLLSALSARAEEGEPARPLGLLYAAGEGIAVISLESREIADAVETDGPVSSLAFSPDGARAFVAIASTRSGGKGPGHRSGVTARPGLYVLEIGKSVALRRITEEPAKEVRWHPAGREILVLEGKRPPDAVPPGAPGKTGAGAGKKKTVPEVCHLRSVDISGAVPRPGPAIPLGVGVQDFVVSPDARTVYLLDPEAGVLVLVELGERAADGARSVRPLKRLELERRTEAGSIRPSLARLVVDDAGKQAGVLLDGPTTAGAILIDLDARRSREVLTPGGATLRAGRFLPDGKRMLALAVGRLLLIDLQAGKVVSSVDLGESFTSLALSAKGEEIYLGTPLAIRHREAAGRGLVEVLDGESLDLLVDIPLAGREARLLAVTPATAAPRPAR